MNMHTTQIESEEIFYVTIPKEFGYKEGDKFSISYDEKHDSIVLKPFVDVEIDIDDKLFLDIAKMAHEQDITFNECVNRALKQKLDEE